MCLSREQQELLQQFEGHLLTLQGDGNLVFNPSYNSHRCIHLRH